MPSPRSRRALCRMGAPQRESRSPHATVCRPACRCCSAHGRRAPRTRSASASTGWPRRNTAATTRRSPPGSTPKHGLKVTIRQGGPQVNQMQLMMAGRLDFNLGGGRAIEFVQQNLPFVAIAAMFQKDPSVLIAHPGQGNDSFAALKGKPILIGADTRAGWWRFLAGQVRLHRRADPPLHVQPAAVPGRQDTGAAGLPRLRAVRHRAGGAFQAGGAAAGRCRLRRLRQHRHHQHQAGDREARRGAALHRCIDRGLVLVSSTAIPRRRTS